MAHSIFAPVSEAIQHVGPLAVMDGDCALCAFGARMIDRFDRSGTIKITTTQTDLGQSLLAHYGLRLDDPESWLFLHEGVAYEGFEAVMRIGRQCGGIGHLLRVMRVLPRPLQDRLYAFIARNRYRVFGLKQLCEIPSPSLQARIVG